MNKSVIKVAACCFVTTLTIAGTTFTTNAMTLSTDIGAGIAVALEEGHLSNPNIDAEIINYLEPSEYADIAIAQVDNYVNIRNMSSEEGEVVGKLYNNSAATVHAEENGWYQITSGNCTGYVKCEFVVTGDEAETLAKEVGHRVATVNTETLKVREDATQESDVVTLVPNQEQLDVQEELDGWVRVSLDRDVVGFVSSDYVDIKTDFVEAESREEEEARLAAEEADRKAAAAEAKKADDAAKAKSDKANAKKSGETKGSSSAGTSGSRQNIVNYAMQFKGNPYVYGGTSLTNGADCSGFTMSVMANNGVGIPRDSRSQAASGREVSLDSIQPGDLLFYSSGGSINHVALYIGGGQVIHASTPESGIKVSNAYYRTPCKAVSYLN